MIQQAPPNGIFTISRSLSQMGTALKHKAIVMFGFEKDTAKVYPFIVSMHTPNHFEKLKKTLHIISFRALLYIKQNNCLGCTLGAERVFLLAD